MNLFAQITKVDEAKRMVYLRTAHETLDKADEIFDYATSKPYFEEWSKNQFEASMGKSYGNVRAMHNKVAAGIIAEPLGFNDVDKAIDAAFKITDDQEWRKCLDGTYTGASIGGSYVDGSRKTEKMASGKVVTRYTAKPAEISLVDSPCIPTCKFFEVVKADGSLAKVDFKAQEPTPENAVDELAKMLNAGTIDPAQLVKLAKASLEPKPAEPAAILKTVGVTHHFNLSDPACKIDPVTEVKKADEPKTLDAVAAHNAKIEAKAREMAKEAFPAMPEIERLGKAEDGRWTDYVAPAARWLADPANAEKPAAVAKVETASQTQIAAQTQAAVAKVEAAKPAEIAKTDAPKPAEVAKADPAKPEPVAKGLWNVQSFADALQSLAYITLSAQSDLDWEGDSSPIPAQLRSWVAQGVQIFQAMSLEESNELVAALNVQGSTVLIEMAARATMVKRVAAPDLTVTEITEFAKKYLPLADLAKKGFEDIRTELAKVGARNSKTDQGHLQSAHDHLVKAGASCPLDHSDAAPVIAIDTIKVDAGPLLKLSAEIGDLRKTIIDRDGAITELTTRLKKVEDTPVQPKGVLRVFDKNHDIQNDRKDEPEIISTPGQHNPAVAQAMIKQQIVAREGMKKF